MIERRARISIEREVALWKGGRPLSAQATARFKDMLDSRKDELGASCIDREVAQNSIEAKFSLISKESAASTLRRFRQGLERIAGAHGIEVCWTNQPNHAPSGHNEYFTTLAFPSLVDTFVHANSVHIHFEVSPEDAMNAYRQMNAIAPWFIVNSSHFGGGRGRLEMLGEFVRRFGDLAIPQDFRSIGEFASYMADMSSGLERMMGFGGALDEAMERFPHMFDQDGRLALTPDKIFHPARIRPDLRLPNGNISLEFRALDAMADIESEISMVLLATRTFDTIIRGANVMATLQSSRDFLLSCARGRDINPDAVLLPESLHEERRAVCG